MTIDAADVLSTLILVAPGFIGLKVFYLLAPGVKRTDAGWLIWSLIWAAPIVALGFLIRNALGPWPGIGGLQDVTGVDAAFVVIVYVVGIISGLFAGVIWNIVAPRFPTLQRRALGPAWSGVIASGGWLTVHLDDGRIAFGYAASYGNGADGSDDLYLECPAWYDGDADRFVSMEPAEGLWISPAHMKYIGVQGSSSVWAEAIGQQARSLYASPAAQVEETSAVTGKAGQV